MRYSLESVYLAFTAGVFVLDLNLKNKSIKAWSIRLSKQYLHTCVCIYVRACACVLSQVPLSMGFPRDECWSELLFPPPGDWTHVSCIVGRFSITWVIREASFCVWPAHNSFSLWECKRYNRFWYQWNGLGICFWTATVSSFQKAQTREPVSFRVGSCPSGPYTVSLQYLHHYLKLEN